MSGIEAIAAERQRQMDVEGWTPEHDDEHQDGSLVGAAMAYIAQVHGYKLSGWAEFLSKEKWIAHWPTSWHRDWYKPKDKRADLVRAGALIAAEIDRLDRL